MGRGSPLLLTETFETSGAIMLLVLLHSLNGMFHLSWEAGRRNSLLKEAFFF